MYKARKNDRISLDQIFGIVAKVFEVSKAYVKGSYYLVKSRYGNSIKSEKDSSNK
jgi:hypothetical protein